MNDVAFTREIDPSADEKNTLMNEDEQLTLIGRVIRFSLIEKNFLKMKMKDSF